MKIKVWTFVSDGADGSVSVTFYKSKAEAEARYDEELEEGYAVFDESVDCTIIDTDEFEVVG